MDFRRAFDAGVLTIQNMIVYIDCSIDIHHPHQMHEAQCLVSISRDYDFRLWLVPSYSYITRQPSVSICAPDPLNA